MENSYQQIARVIEVRKNSFILDFDGQEISAKLRGSFYDTAADRFPVVGDFVTILYNPAGDSVIQSVRERKSLLKRTDSSKPVGTHHMIANADYCFIVTSLNGDYSYNRIARYAGIALQSGVIPVAVLTKADLCGDAERYVREVATISDKLRVHAVSALYGIGMDDLRQYFVPGVTICLMGSSGAGKSTLINALAGEEIMKTNGIRLSDSKGRHTTTHRQLIRLKNGASVIDTPGMREVGLREAEEGVRDTFSDIADLESRCRFRNCRHDTEPGCAVKAALASGELSMERFMLYRDLETESIKSHAKMKEISKWAKAYKKNRDRMMQE